MEIMQIKKDAYSDYKGENGTKFCDFMDTTTRIRVLIYKNFVAMHFTVILSDLQGCF